MFVNNHFLPIFGVVILLGLGFFGGSLWKENKLLKAGNLANPTTAPAGAQPQTPSQPTKGATSVDDDPVLGDKNAPVTIVEFSDYECPFCKRHFDQTLPQLLKNYVTAGKVKIVYRDFPLSFHDPMATKEAVAANCARAQGGDTTYFKYHDEIFTRTTSNGNGLSETDLTTIATDLGLNLNSFNSCLADPAQKDEVQKDVTAASQAGATGTPTFVIGKSTSDGTIDGDLVVGAQPYSVFQAIIDPLL
jgi:protein-disulfide isomerase